MKLHKKEKKEQMKERKKEEGQNPSDVVGYWPYLPYYHLSTNSVAPKKSTAMYLHFVSVCMCVHVTVDSRYLEIVFPVGTPNKCTRDL